MDLLDDLPNSNETFIHDTHSCLGLINEFNNNGQGKINIFQSNIRSMNKNFINLETILKCLSVMFDVIILTETWICESLDFFNLDGYDVYYNYSKINRCDGVIVFVKSAVTCTNKIIECLGFKFMRTSILLEMKK